MVTLRPLALALLLAACRTVQQDTAAPILSPARSPDVAIADAAAIKDPARAGEIAWIEGNDRVFAKKRLDEGLAAHPKDPGLHLRRALIASIELDAAGELGHLLAVVRDAPESPEAEVALILLHDWLSDHLESRKEIKAALGASGIFADPPADAEDRATRVAIATSIMSRLDALDRDEAAMRNTVTRGGWLTTWRSIGPLAPRIESVLATPTEQETRSIDVTPAPTLRGLAPPIRKIDAWRLTISPVAGELIGLYVMETYVELDANAAGKPLVLQINARDSGRVLVDGTRVHAMKSGARTARSYKRVKLELTPGWHRISVALLATGASRPSFSLLGADGSRVIAKQQAEAPSGVALGRTPPVIASDSVIAASAEAYADRLASSPEHALFGHMLGGVLALTHLRDDLDRAKRLLTTAVELAPKSAAIVAAEARLQGRSGLPASMSQARFRDALALDPENPALLLRLARSVQADQPDLALSIVDHAEKNAPTAAEPHELRFRILEARGWNAEAARSLERALAARATESLISEGATFYRNMLRFDQAKALEERALSISEPSPGSRAATLALLRGDADAAVAALREAAKAISNPGGYYVRIATIELGRGRIDAAVAASNDALADDPLNPAALRILAIAARANGDRKEADAFVEKLRSIGAGDLRVETFASELAGLYPGVPDPGSWLAKELDADPRALVAASKDIDPRFQRYKSVRLLDRVIDRVSPDGHALSLRHALIRLQTKEATDQAGETNLPSDALSLALRTIKADGRIIDVDRHSGKDDLSFSALAPGDAIEKQWVIIEAPETAWGGYLRRFFFQGSSPSLENVYAVTFPKGAKIWWKSYNGAPSPVVHEEAATTTYLFRAKNVPAVDPEPASVSQEEYLPFVVVAIELDPERAMLANRSLVEDLANGAWDIDRRANALVEGKKSDADKVRAIYDFVSIEVDDGDARDPSVVLTTKRGRRTGLFIAMLRAVGIEASIALARQGSAARVSPPYPLPARYGVPLVRIELADPPGKQTIWARMDKENTWMGKATPEMRGGEYILPESPSTSVEPIAFNDAEVDRWMLDSSVDLTIDAQGNAKGTVTLVLPGNFGSSLREFLKTARADDIDRALQEWVAVVLPGAQLERWEARHRDEPLLPLELVATLAVPSFMVLENDTLIAEQFFEAPIATHALGLPSLNAYLRLPVRVTPLWVNEIAEHMKVSITLPNGSASPLESPKSFREESKWGRFTQAFSWDAAHRRVHLEVEQSLPAQRVPAAEFPKLRDAAQQILQATRNRLIVPLGRVEQARGESIRDMSPAK